MEKFTDNSVMVRCVPEMHSDLSLWFFPILIFTFPLFPSKNHNLPYFPCNTYII